MKLRKPPRIRLALLLTLLFVAYSSLILWNAFSAQRQVREAALREFTDLADKHADSLSTFLSERAEDVLDLAQSTPVQSLFLNRRLGMSMQYGLSANLGLIESAFRSFRMRKTQDLLYLYSGIGLLDSDGQPLAGVGDAHTHADGTQATIPGSFMTPDQPEARLYLDDAHQLVVISTQLFNNDEFEGLLFAQMPADRLAKHLDLNNPASPIRDTLVDSHGRPLLALPIHARLMAVHAAAIAAMANGERRVLAVPGGDNLVAVKTNLSDTGYALVTAVPESYLEERTTPSVYLIIAAMVPVVVLLATFYLLRLQETNRELAGRFQESDRQRDALAQKTAMLEQEIGRREAVEAELRRQGTELEKRSGELRQAMAEVTQLARFDSLTGLNNRAQFRDNLHLAIQRARREGKQLAIMFIDLDRFKRINDTLGHSAGDELLKSIAQRVVRSIRETDSLTREVPGEDPWCVARQGGDEFTLLLTELNDALPVAHVAQRIIQAILQPLRLSGHEVVVTCSIGISIYPDDGDDEDTLLKNADTAMYTAKEHGRNQYRFFEPAMQAKAMRRMELENDLMQAMDRGELSMHYQPIVHTGDRLAVAYEALLRWRHPVKGMIPPSEFIPLAEESGQIITLTNFALHNAAMQAREWQQKHGTTPRIAVNLSGRIIDLVDVPHMAQGALRAGPSQVNWLELELTESSVMQRHTAVIGMLQQLRQLGVRVSIDDFGTGYSSLAYLKAFAIDTLKVDRSFVMDLPADPNSGAIVHAIIAMAHALDLEVVAEGVETPAQYHYLTEAGCDMIQGYLVGKPVPPGLIRNPSHPEA